MFMTSASTKNKSSIAKKDFDILYNIFHILMNIMYNNFHN